MCECDTRDPRFGSVADLMAATGWGERAVRSGIRNGTIPAVQVGKNWSIPIRAFLATLERGSTPEAEDLEGAEVDDSGVH